MIETGLLAFIAIIIGLSILSAVIAVVSVASDTMGTIADGRRCFI